jgi:SPP1 gp7 family putative phage head morphogenesis protein
MKRRFAWLRNQVWQLVVVEDAFGMGPKKTGPDGFSVNTRWAFEQDPKKVEQFRAWFAEQVDEGLLETDRRGGTPWTSQYTTSAYQRGVAQGFTAAKAGELAEQASIFAGGQQQFLADAFAGQLSTRQIELLATRAFDQLRGISADMSSQMSRTLTDGFVRGESPRKIAAKMQKGISGIEKKRALTLARTEIVHAHAEGTLDSFDFLGIEDVSVMAEWKTTLGACPICSAMEGVVLSVSEARGMIPRHPSCRCAWIPSIPQTRAKGQGKVQKEEVQTSIRESIKNERRRGTLEEKQKASTWAGADVKPSGKVPGTPAPAPAIPASPLPSPSAVRAATRDEWIKGLTEKERDAIDEWVEYKTHGRTVTYRTMRKEALTPGSQKPEVQEALRHLESALAKAPLVNHPPMYRGLSITPDKLQGLDEAGSVLTINAPSSFTRDVNIAEGVAGGSSDVTILVVEKGKRGAHLDGVHRINIQEDEVLVPQGVRYRITGRSTRIDPDYGTKYHVIDLEEINE